MYAATICSYLISVIILKLYSMQKEMRCQFSLNYVNIESVLPQIMTVSGVSPLKGTRTALS